ncbi:hypothetical protein MLP_02830 [Microlunatus phosphovorus NM-1]|uniref:Uncharacterized protein n=1 Tax=Microlunatus phosphovorus (strain ATCC 700054 / DSM 10555 / JCM 9379 / NBRC 101784 / NCIMB 13414 / VKM Ac-1990 / NM-1) TaxID=1032480 RepID=F5XIX1_MICPN|nr:hypothetical protein MLP_02830 [Microlunatus phosphovorus NM-1]
MVAIHEVQDQLIHSLRPVGAEPFSDLLARPNQAARSRPRWGDCLEAEVDAKTDLKAWAVALAAGGSHVRR